MNKRFLTNGERAELDRILALRPSALMQIGAALATIVLSWLLMMSVIVVVWLAISWLSRKVFVFEIGWGTPIGNIIFFLGLGLTAIYSIWYGLTWYIRAQKPRNEIDADSRANLIIDEYYTLTQCVRYQEQEHGGLMYFFLTNENKVLVLFDYESQDLGVEGKDPLTSSFSPRVTLNMSRLPQSRIVIESKFTGEKLDLGEVRDLLLPPAKWPDFEEYYDCPWSDLEKCLEHV